jgi:hypothetical protein
LRRIRLCRAATSAAMYKPQRKARRPPKMVRLPRKVPLSRLKGVIFLRKRGQGFLLFNQLLGLVKLPSNSSGD